MSGGMSDQTRREVSAGAVITRGDHPESQVCLIVTTQHGTLTWCLPKGHIEPGEQPQACAIREVREETGLVGEPIEKLGSISYQFDVPEEQLRCDKTVHFFLLRYVEGDTRDHDAEVEDAVWLAIDEALKRLEYPGERRMLVKAKRILGR